MKESNKIIVKISQDDESVGYIYMPLDENVNKKILKTLSLSELVDGYNGIPVYFDLNEDNELIGIEISG